MIINFINDVFLIILISFCIVFFIAGDRFEMFGQYMKALFPIAIFAIIFLIKLRIDRNQLKKRKKDNNTEIILYLTFFDKLILDTLIYLLPIIVLIIAFTMNNKIIITDIFQALSVFLLTYFWQKFLFKKEK